MSDGHYMIACCSNNDPNKALNELQASVQERVKYGYMPVGGVTFAHSANYAVMQALWKPPTPDA